MENQQKVAVITGAAGGIGRALAEGFVEDGYLVAAVDLPSSDVMAVAKALGPGHAGFHCDIGSEEQIKALFVEIELSFGRIDVLVNNAALGPTMAATVDTSAADFRAALSVNLAGPFVMAREAASRMGSTGGVIVNIASLAGIVANPRRNAYAASKAGLISVTKSLACEWAHRNIRVVAVAPGYVRTPMVAGLERDGKADLSKVRQRIPMGRMARPDEIAAAARFLASPSARYITGSVLPVDGGWASFNQPGTAHPPVEGTPQAELERPAGNSNPRVVVVTGGAKGIGQAIAEAFAANGDTIVIVDRDVIGAEKAAATLGTRHAGIGVDISSESNVIELFADIGRRFGKVDVLVNNAAIADTFMPAQEQTAAYLTGLLDTNLTGAFLCAREALKLMDRPGGIIINLGSINTFLPFAPRHAYGASKAGVDMLTRCMAGELGPEGIRIATIAPGYIRTPGVAVLEQSGKVDAQKLRRRIPMGDLGRPSDIADAALFLASPKASYITGSILYVDGGWTSFGNAGDASTLDEDMMEAAQ